MRAAEIDACRRLLLQDLKQTIETMDAHGWPRKPVKRGARHDYYRAHCAVRNAPNLKELLVACLALASRDGRAWDCTFGVADGAGEADLLLAGRVEPCARRLAELIGEEGVERPPGAIGFADLPPAALDGQPG